MMKNGRRNISISTVAPTGTLSLLTRTSSGIEPVYMLGYTRRRKLGPNAPKEAVAFTDAMGDQWEEFTVHHPRLVDWMKATGKTDVKESPYANCTANDIDWHHRVRLQAAVQKQLFRIEAPTDEAHGLCELIVRCAEEVNAAIPLLRDKRELKNLHPHVVEINRLEREADALHRRALEKLIAESQGDWFNFMRWKDIYEKLEDATDLCEDIADVLQTIVLKHG